MNYKLLFDRILLIISKPQEAWVKIKAEDKQKVMTSFVYPLLAISSVAAFIGELFSSEVETAAAVFSAALAQACLILITLFGGFYLACFVAEQLYSKFLKVSLPKEVCVRLIGYGFVLVFLKTICVALLPDFRFIVYILQFYAIYILWEAIPVFLTVKEEDRLKATLFLFASIFVCPLAIEYLFGKLI